MLAILSFTFAIRFGLEELLGLWPSSAQTGTVIYGRIGLPLSLFTDTYYPAHAPAAFFDVVRYTPILSLNVIFIYLSVVILAALIIRYLINSPLLTLFISVSIGGALHHLLIFCTSSDPLNLWQEQTAPSTIIILTRGSYLFLEYCYYSSHIALTPGKEKPRYLGYFVSLVYINNGLLGLVSYKDVGRC